MHKCIIVLLRCSNLCRVSVYQLPAPCHHGAAAAAASAARSRRRHQPRGLHRAPLPRPVRPVRGPARLQGRAPGAAGA